MKIHIRHASGNSRQLDLFDWADSLDRKPGSLPVRRIAKRFGISRYHAQTIAELAGFQMEARP